MQKNRVVCSLLTVSLLVGGCCNSQKDITLDAAMTSVGLGLYHMHNAAHPPGASDKPFGLYAKDVTVTFNVQASTTNKNELVLSADVAPPVIPIKAGISDTASTSTTNSRGNTIVVTFKNPAFAEPGTLIHDTVTGATASAAPAAPKETSPAQAPAAAPAPALAANPAPEKPQSVDRASDRVDAFERLLGFLDTNQQPSTLQLEQLRQNQLKRGE